MVHIILTGATGLLGGAIARALLQQGHDLVCAVRDPARLALAGPRCRALQADLAQTTTGIGTCAAPCTYDFNRDNEIWVQAQSTVRGKKRNVVARMRLEQVSEILPRAGVTAGALSVTNSGGHGATPMIDAIDGVAHVMLKLTGYVMNFAPIAVLAAVSGIIAKSGLGVLSTYGVFMAQFYFGIALLWVVLIAIGMIFVGPRILRLIAELRGPTLLAFSTASSEAASSRRTPHRNCG